MENIVENNKLIAEFMGLYKGFHAFEYESGQIPEWAEKEESNTLFLTDLKYHNSWDWLMPVVEKIGKLPNFLHPNGMYKY